MTKCPHCKELRACVVTGQDSLNGYRVGYFWCVFCKKSHAERLNGRSVRLINKEYRDYKR